MDFSIWNMYVRYTLKQEGKHHEKPICRKSKKLEYICQVYEKNLFEVPFNEFNMV